MATADKYEYVVIEPQGLGLTYHNPKPTVYGFKTNPESSVLAGKMSRYWLGSFDTVEEALEAFPMATPSPSCSFVEYTDDIPPAWCTPTYEAETGERWSDD